MPGEVSFGPAGVALCGMRFHACTRPGSLDASITEEVANGCPALFAKYPSITNVFFNGRKPETAFAAMSRSCCRKIDSLRAPAEIEASAANAIFSHHQGHPPLSNVGVGSNWSPCSSRPELPSVHCAFET